MAPVGFDPLPASTDDLVPLALVVKRACATIYHDLQIIADTFVLPFMSIGAEHPYARISTMSESQRHRVLLDWILTSRKLLERVLVLERWAVRDAQTIQRFQSIVKYVKMRTVPVQEELFGRTLGLLRLDTALYSIPRFSIETAMAVLSHATSSITAASVPNGSRSIPPTLPIPPILSDWFQSQLPSEPPSDATRQRILRSLHSRLRIRLLRDPQPPALFLRAPNHVKVKDGNVEIRVDGEYVVQMHPREIEDIESGPWWVTRVELHGSMRGLDEREYVARVLESLRLRMENVASSVNVFDVVHQHMHELCLRLRLYMLFQESAKLARTGKWAGRVVTQWANDASTEAFRLFFWVSEATQKTAKGPPSPCWVEIRLASMIDSVVPKVSARERYMTAKPIEATSISPLGHVELMYGVSSSPTTPLGRNVSLEHILEHAIATEASRRLDRLYASFESAQALEFQALDPLVHDEEILTGVGGSQSALRMGTSPRDPSEAGDGHSRSFAVEYRRGRFAHVAIELGSGRAVLSASGDSNGSIPAETLRASESNLNEAPDGLYEICLNLRYDSAVMDAKLAAGATSLTPVTLDIPSSELVRIGLDFRRTQYFRNAPFLGAYFAVIVTPVGLQLLVILTWSPVDESLRIRSHAVYPRDLSAQITDDGTDEFLVTAADLQQAEFSSRSRVAYAAIEHQLAQRRIARAPVSLLRETHGDTLQGSSMSPVMFLIRPRNLYLYNRLDADELLSDVQICFANSDSRDVANMMIFIDWRVVDEGVAAALKAANQPISVHIEVSCAKIDRAVEIFLEEWDRVSHIALVAHQITVNNWVQRIGICMADISLGHLAIQFDQYWTDIVLESSAQFRREYTMHINWRKATNGRPGEYVLRFSSTSPKSRPPSSLTINMLADELNRTRDLRRIVTGVSAMMPVYEELQRMQQRAPTLLSQKQFLFSVIARDAVSYRLYLCKSRLNVGLDIRLLDDKRILLRDCSAQVKSDTPLPPLQTGGENPWSTMIPVQLRPIPLINSLTNTRAFLEKMRKMVSERPGNDYGLIAPLPDGFIVSGGYAAVTIRAIVETVATLNRAV